MRDIPHGERTTVTSTDPAMVVLLRQHAQSMRVRLLYGDNLRPADPVFVELFRRHSEVYATIRNIPGGVTEVETSKNPQVVLLIRAHAREVGEFVRYGMPRAKQSSPLPKGYVPATPSTDGQN